jgi:hypothetical protein
MVFSQRAFAMPAMDTEAMLYLFNRHPCGLVTAKTLLANARAHRVAPGDAQAALSELVARGTLQWAPGAKLCRPD